MCAEPRERLLNQPSPDETSVRTFTRSLAHPGNWPGYAQGAGVVGFCTILAWDMASYFTLSNLLMIYLIGTVGVATHLGRGPSIVTAGLSVLVFDFLFIPPRFRFAISDVEHLFALAVIVAVAAIISNRSARLRQHAVAVRQYERQAAAAAEAARAMQVAQLQGLAAAALAVSSTLSVDETLEILTERARQIIDCHLAISGLTTDQDWGHAIHAVALSDKYAAWRDFAQKPDGSGVYRLVCEANRPMRLTQAQLESHPAWRGFGKAAGVHPPLRGWLAVPLIGVDGRNIGLIQLSDKNAGEFTEADESILVHLAQMGAIAIEKIRSYEDAEWRRRAAEQLYAMSRDVSTALDVPSLLQVALRHIGEVFATRVLVLFPDAGGKLAPRWRYPETAEPEPGELAVSRWAYEHGEAAGLGTRVFFAERTLHLPLVGARETIGVLSLAPRNAGGIQAPGHLLLLETFTSQIALALERATLAEQAHEAHLRMETERLRSTLLSSISHDLRTPLATITLAASSLLWRNEEFDPETQRELKESIYEESERLARLVDNLLNMTRLESGIQARKASQPLEDVVGAALARMERRLHGRHLTTSLPHDLPLVLIDDVLIEQVLINLLDNAIKYTGSESPLELSAFVSDGVVTVQLADRGPGLDPGDEERVFEKFHRGASGPRQGAGLGLAICRGIIDAHGGRIWAENGPDGGAVFRFTLPMESVPADIEAPHG
jgi:K+-sensing histidine kinase KdpD